MVFAPICRKAAKIRGTNGFAESVCLHISELLEQELTQSGFTQVDGIPHLNARNLARFYAYRVLFDILELLEEDSEYSIEEILDAYKLIASCEGVLAEPASAASVAGLIKCRNTIRTGAKCVCILTGNGLKDPDNAIKYAASEVKKTSSDIKEILNVMSF